MHLLLTRVTDFPIIFRMTEFPPVSTCRRHLRIFSLIGMVALVMPVEAQEKGAGLPLPELNARFDEALALIDQPITNLNTSYMEALKRLMTAETEKANLKGALEVKQEIDRIGDGKSDAWTAMRRESTDHPAVAEMEKKYMAEQTRLWNAGKRNRGDLVTSYLAALGLKKKELTKLGRIPEALEVRKIRDSIAEDPRMSGDDPSGQDPNSLPARIHLVAKGEVELTHKGERLSCQNISSNKDLIKKATDLPGRGTPDSDMTAMWAGKTLSEISRTGSEWAKSGPGEAWHTYAIVIEPEMFPSATGGVTQSKR